MSLFSDTREDRIMGNLYYPDKEIVRTKFRLSAGARGIRETLQLMADHAIQGAESAPIWSLSRKLVGGYKCPVHDQVCQADIYLRWIHENISWVPDIGTAETVAAPWRTLEVKAGDCDDLSSLLASMAVSVGIPARFKAIAANPDHPNEFTHVYVEMLLEDEWIPADPSVAGKPLGWESPMIFKEMYEDVWVEE